MIIRKHQVGLEIKTPAKVNLYLEIVRRRPDGYHDIESVFDPVSLYDTMIVEPTPNGEGVELTCSEASVPCGSTNTVVRAWHALKETYPGVGNVRVHIDKKIPPGSGLGGGSTNAAGMLMCLNELFSLGLSMQELASIGETIGSDVPFFFAGSRAWVTGRGENVEPLSGYDEQHYVLVFPGINVSTELIYKNVTPALTISPRSAILNGGHMTLDFKPLNRLETCTFRLFPQLKATRDTLSELHDGNVLMSGSGSTLACLCTSEVEAASLLEVLVLQGFDNAEHVHSVKY